MVLAAFLLASGESVLLQAPTVLIYAGVLLVPFHLFIVLYEEPNLRHRFGSSYEAYIERVPRWLPVARARAEKPA